MCNSRNICFSNFAHNLIAKAFFIRIILHRLLNLTALFTVHQKIIWLIWKGPTGLFHLCGFLESAYLGQWKKIEEKNKTAGFTWNDRFTYFSTCSFYSFTEYKILPILGNRLKHLTKLVNEHHNIWALFVFGTFHVWHAKFVRTMNCPSNFVSVYPALDKFTVNACIQMFIYMRIVTTVINNIYFIFCHLDRYVALNKCYFLLSV